MKRLIRTLIPCVLLAGGARAAVPDHVRGVAEALPSREVEILLSVGREYELGNDMLKLLLTIRRIENGRPGYEMGVASDFPNHRAHRYSGNLDKSLRVQARWAAGTIRKYYTGDLTAFARRYCPPRAEHWTRMARSWMGKD